MSSYIGNIPFPQATQQRSVFTASAGQTTFSTAATGGYSVNFVDVYLNGVKLVNVDDYTATDGINVVLSAGAALNDTVEVISYETFSVGGGFVPISGGSFTGSVTFGDTGAIQVPVGTEAQRPSAVKGQFRFNDDEDTFEGYNGTEWGPLGGDLSSVAEDIIPDSDGTRDIGTVAKKFDQGRFNGITASNITDSDGVTVQTTYVTNGSAKAWVNFNGTGTIAARDSLNVSSLTDNGTADYNINITSSFGAVDFATTGSGIGDSTSVNRADCVVASINASTVSSINIATRNSSSAVDPTHVNVVAVGDLA